MSNKKLFIALQYLLPHFLLTRLAGWLASCPVVWWKNWLIRDFIRRYKIDLSIATTDNLNNYPTFNDFFTRALKPSARPINPEKNIIVSPIDGCISQIGKIEKSTLLQAKGSLFTVNELFGNQTNNLRAFDDGHFATFYLSPKDYHRVHAPFDGKLIQTIYIPGKLFSVNPLATEKIPKLFARNERLVCIFDTAIGPMAVVLIGAMLVGKIQTSWGLTERANNIITRDYAMAENINLHKGAELGRFLMGSSVILLFGKGTIQWLPDLHAETCVRMGQALGTTS